MPVTSTHFNEHLTINNSRNNNNNKPSSHRNVEVNN